MSQVERGNSDAAALCKHVDMVLPGGPVPSTVNEAATFFPIIHTEPSAAASESRASFLSGSDVLGLWGNTRLSESGIGR